MTRRTRPIAHRRIPVVDPTPVQLVLGLPLGVDLDRVAGAPSPIAPVVAVAAHRRAAA